MNIETTVMGMQSKSQVLIDDLRSIIDGARRQVAVAANSEMTMMYWHIGERINYEVLGNQRAEYGKQIVATIAGKLWNQRLRCQKYSSNDEICTNV